MQNLFQVFMKLLGAIIFWKMFLVIFDKFLQLLL